MTIQEAYKKIMDSEDLKKKAIEALKAGKGNEFLKEQGIDLTVDQIKEAIQAKKSGELSKSELNLAAGGGCDNNECIDGTDCGYQALFSIASIGIGCAISTSDDDKTSVICHA